MSAILNSCAKRSDAIRKQGCYKPLGFGSDGDADLASSRDNFLYNLRLWLWVRGMKPVHLSRLSGVSQSRISNWQKGLHAPSMDQLDRIADALKIPPSYLLYDRSDARSGSPSFELVAKTLRFQPSVNPDRTLTMAEVMALGDMTQDAEVKKAVERIVGLKTTPPEALKTSPKRRKTREKVKKKS